MKKIISLILAISISFLFSTTAKANADALSVEFELVKPKGYLKHDYRAGIFRMQNNGSNPVKVFEVDFTGDKPIDFATDEARSHDKAALAVLWAFGIGFFWLFLIPLAIALVATPFVLIKRGMTRKKTREEQWEYNEKAPREVTIEPGASEELVGIFPEEMLSTRLKFSVKDLTTGSVKHYEDKYILDEDEYADELKRKEKND